MDARVTQEVPRLIVQLSIILLAAKLSGEMTERFSKVPGVLGELVTGMSIGPYASGGLEIPYLAPSFL